MTTEAIRRLIHKVYIADILIHAALSTNSVFLKRPFLQGTMQGTQQNS